MRREERRNLRPDAKKSPTHIFVSLFFFFFFGWRRTETKNSRRWENMIFLLVSLTFATYLLCRDIPYYIPLPLSFPFSHSLYLLLHYLSFSHKLKLCTITYFVYSVRRSSYHTHTACNYLFIKYNFVKFFIPWKIKLLYCCQIEKFSNKTFVTFILIYF